MPPVPATVDMVVADMPRALAFYRRLGLAIPAERDGDVQVEVAGTGGYSLGFVSEAAVRQAIPDWPAPVGQRVTLAFRCDGPAEVDRVAADMAAAGFTVAKAPWDSFWGQRYAFLLDPDGNRVDLFAALAEE